MFNRNNGNPSLKSNISLSLLMLLALLLTGSVSPAVAGEKYTAASADTVRAVLFFSPTCGHCHQVIGQDLPPLQEKYGDRLEILLVDTSTPEGRELFISTAEKFKDQREIRGVPALVVGEQVLIGSIEIPEQFPSIIETGLSSGGIDWPAIPGLVDMIPVQAIENGPSDTLEPTTPAQAQTNEDNPKAAPVSNVPSELSISPRASSGMSSENPIYIQRFLQDPVGNSIAVITLVGMLVSIVVVGFYFIRTTGEDIDHQPRVLSWPSWAIPVLSIAGLGVAGYMSYVEITRVEAICGPVGDCNSVQQSPYATLWGFLPVGILGMLGYVAIAGAWYLHRYGPANIRSLFALAIWGMALLGTLFSVYLTFLEPFVIGATCAWCISSAVLITMLLWASTWPALQSISQLTGEV